MTPTNPVHIVLDGFHNRDPQGWYRDIPLIGNIRHIPTGGFRSLMRKHAHKHGYAGALRCDDSFLLFYRVGKKIRQRTFKKAVVTT